MLNTQNVIETLRVLPAEEHAYYLRQVSTKLSGDESNLLVSDLTDYLLRAPDLAEKLETGIFTVFGRTRFLNVIKSSPRPDDARLH
jgi:hypothetical protein